MKKRFLGITLAMMLGISLIGCSASDTKEQESTSQETVATETVSPEATTEKAEEITYMKCTVEELLYDIYEDEDAAREKYENQYLEISGIVDECGLDDSSTPPGKEVYLKDTIKGSEEYPSFWIAALSWGNDYPQEKFEEDIEGLSEGDNVTLRVYATDYSLDNLDEPWISFDLLEVVR